MLKKQRTTSTNIGFETRKRLRQTKDTLCRATCLPAPSLKSKQGFRTTRTGVQVITRQVRKQCGASHQPSPRWQGWRSGGKQPYWHTRHQSTWKMKQNKTSELCEKWLLHLNPSRCPRCPWLPLVSLSELSVPPHDSASQGLTAAIPGSPRAPASGLSPGAFDRLVSMPYHLLNIKHHLYPLSSSCDAQISGSYEVTSSLGKPTSSPFLRSTQ